ncbi:death ligand signal enhancer [Trichonephila clavata]|uniref:Death ligand signal enhancer n=1 Tax=Trichonephila clavata TaxID=2740835 RepID=A0A8X6KTD2_TRICU|nr:death ligand signal enhancer [Trichonephila clavata]
MWKFTRTLVFSRWNLNNCKFNENKSKKTPGIQTVIVAAAPPNKKKKSNEQNDWKKEHFSQRFWNCPQFQFLLSKSLFFETAGWLSTVSIICFNLHRKNFSSMLDNERIKNHCIFSTRAKALPKNSHKENKDPENYLEPPNATEKPSSIEASAEPFQDILQDLGMKSNQYAAAAHNNIGLSNLNKNNKKAFRSFQTAARLGSSQGFYNLGLCHELGLGTKVNLTRAAFCYRKAAMKGHGLASFNLAVYFHKGIGGLPVDHEISKLLIEQAAAKNIPQAQLYLGLEYLEKEEWSDAYEVFCSLASADNTDGKYYLGLCYENGWGINKDEKAAVEFFSQNATVGHTKSILSLIKYYEEGLGGCPTDLDFALALSQILADQGNEEGKKAVLRLKTKKYSSKVTALFKENVSSLKTKRTYLHISSSFPELTSIKDTKPKSYSLATIPSYFGFVTSFSSMKTHHLDEKKNPDYFINEKLNATPYIQHLKLNIAPTLVAKT